MNESMNEACLSENVKICSMQRRWKLE